MNTQKRCIYFFIIIMTSSPAVAMLKRTPMMGLYSGTMNPDKPFPKHSINAPETKMGQHDRNHTRNVIIGIAAAAGSIIPLFKRFPIKIRKI